LDGVVAACKRVEILNFSAINMRAYVLVQSHNRSLVSVMKLEKGSLSLTYIHVGSVIVVI
jgi:hypothetical protein